MNQTDATRHLLSASDSASGPACHAEWSARDTGSWHCLPCGEASLHNPKARQTGRKDVFEVIMAKYGLAWGFLTPPSFLWLVILTPTMFLQLKRIKSLYVDFHRNPGPILGKNPPQETTQSKDEPGYTVLQWQSPQVLTGSANHAHPTCSVDFQMWPNESETEANCTQTCTSRWLPSEQQEINQ